MTGPGTMAVTGAGGMLGRHLCAFFGARGWEVRALVRDPGRTGAGVRAFRCDLPEHLEREGVEGADVLVHCAWATRAASAAEARRVNEEGTRRVVEAAREARVGRLVFVSSTSASAEASSHYGRGKATVEASLDAERDLVLRPGLVLARGGGLFERLRGAIARWPLVPVFGGGRQIVQTVHVDDLCRVLERALATDRTGTLTVVEPEGIEYRGFVRAIAERLGRRRLLLPVPYAPALLALRVAEALRIPMPVSSQNLLGLRAMQPVPPSGELAELGVKIRDAWESLDDLLRAATPSGVAPRDITKPPAS